MAWDIKGNKNSFSRYVGKKERPVKMWVLSLRITYAWLFRIRRAETFNDFLALIFTVKCSSHNTQVPVKGRMKNHLL